VDARDNADELEKTINRAVDARIAHVKQELSVKLDACATAIRNEVTAALMPGAHEVRPRFVISGCNFSESSGIVFGWGRLMQQTPAARLRRFSEKVFYVRNSVLTNMLSIPDFQSIEHIFIAMLVWMGVNIMIQVTALSSCLPRLDCGSVADRVICGGCARNGSSTKDSWIQQTFSTLLGAFDCCRARATSCVLHGRVPV
jgi:hypothetical protein